MLYNIVLISAIHQHELAIGTHVPLPLETPSHLPLHPTHLDCHRAPGWSSLRHTANSHWLSVLHMVAFMFQCHCQFLPPSPSLTVSTDLFSMSSSALKP